MSTDGLVGSVLVDSTGVILEVSVDSEGGLDGAAGHDGVLNSGDVVGVKFDGSLERVLVGLEIRVFVGGAVVAGGGATGGRLRLASSISLGGVRVTSVSLGSVVVAVGKGEGSA